MKRIIRNILKPLIHIYDLLIFLYVKVFGWIFYDKKYITGRWFDGIEAEGWKWAARDIFHRLIRMQNLTVHWPCSPDINCCKNIEFDVNDLHNFNGKGTYFQTYDAWIKMGSGCFIANNVSIITSNHDLYDLEKHAEGEDVVLGRDCWVGYNAVILPGVTLGDHTIVGAGSVVAESFPDGYCVIAGVPAKKIKLLDKFQKESISSNCEANIKR